MGDGVQGKQLPVPVPPIGLYQVGRAAVPAEWYRIVTQGNIERFMPPFASLSVQERWDVVAYSLTLHVSQAELQRGRELFETFCGDCPLDLFRDATWMASRSNDELARILREGIGDFAGLAPQMSDGFNELAAYVRTLSFAASASDPQPAAAEPSALSPQTTPVPTSVLSAPETTPSPEATNRPSAATSPEEPSEGLVRGRVLGGMSGLVVTLRGFDHAKLVQGEISEELTFTTIVDANGEFVFREVKTSEDIIYFAEIAYQGVTYVSDPVAGVTSELILPDLRVHEATTDQSNMMFEQVHFFVDVSEEGFIRVVGLYSFSNLGDKTVVIQATDSVPFLPTPNNAQNVEYQLVEGSAAILSAEGGFALPPQSQPYGITHFYVVPYEGKVEIAQPFVWPAQSIVLLAPETVQLSTSQLTWRTKQNFQGVNYNSFSGGPIRAGDTLLFTVSRPPLSLANLMSGISQQGLLLGIGALGLALILAGVWLYISNVRTAKEDEEVSEFGSEEEILDAIIALDDLYRSGKIPEESYQTRRKELKNLLKQMRNGSHSSNA